MASLFWHLLRKLTAFRTGTVLIYRHTQLRDMKYLPEICRVNWDNVDDALHMESPKMVVQFHSFLQGGDVGYYAYLDGTMVHRSWVQFGPGIAQCELGVTFRLEAEDSYVQYCKTHPNARGKGIYTAVLNQIAHDMRAQDRNILIATVQNNPASIRGIEKAGFRLLRRVRSVICFGVPILQTDIRGIYDVLPDSQSEMS